MTRLLNWLERRHAKRTRISNAKANAEHARTSAANREAKP